MVWRGLVSWLPIGRADEACKTFCFLRSGSVEGEVPLQFNNAGVLLNVLRLHQEAFETATFLSLQVQLENVTPKVKGEERATTTDLLRLSWARRGILPYLPVLSAGMTIMLLPSPCLFPHHHLFRLESSQPPPLLPQSSLSLRLHCQWLPRGKEIVSFTCLYNAWRIICMFLWAVRALAWRCMKRGLNGCDVHLALQNIPWGSSLVSLAMPLERFVCAL